MAESVSGRLAATPAHDDDRFRQSVVVADEQGFHARSRRRLIADLLFGSWQARACSFVVGLWVVLASFGPVLTPFDPVTTEVSNRLSGPSGAHWLGTDEFGRDLVSRIIGGAQISLTIATSTAVVCLVVGTMMGVVAGFYRGAAQIVMRFNDALMTVPALVLAIVLMGVLGQGVTTLVIALSAAHLPMFARVAFGEVKALKELDFAQSARAMGCSNWRILTRHFLPSMTSNLTVQTSYVFATAIVAEASLSFLGVGVAPPAPSWGTIISIGKSYTLLDPWMLWPAVVALTSLVLAVSLLGDRLNDALDPRKVEQWR
jgi:peptide/nickel transport system permease protein